MAIESSSPTLSLAAGDHRGSIREWHGAPEWRHAESLFDGMEKLLGQVHWPIQSLTGVAVSIGPGSFTGIRIGLAAARALGQSLKVPVVGISALETMACGAVALSSGNWNRFQSPGRKRELLCPIVDALRGEIFTALYSQEVNQPLKPIVPESRWLVAEFMRRLIKWADPAHPIRLLGDEISAYEAELRPLGSGVKWSRSSESGPRASALLCLAVPRLLEGKKNHYGDVLPLYLRGAAAQERRNS